MLSDLSYSLSSKYEDSSSYCSLVRSSFMVTRDLVPPLHPSLSESDAELESSSLLHEEAATLDFLLEFVYIGLIGGPIGVGVMSITLMLSNLFASLIVVYIVSIAISAPSLIAFAGVL